MVTGTVTANTSLHLTKYRLDFSDASIKAVPVEERRMKNVLMASGLVLVAAPLLLAARVVPQFSAPEPGTIMLLGTGMAGLGFAIWRRNRTKK